MPVVANPPRWPPRIIRLGKSRARNSRPRRDRRLARAVEPCTRRGSRRWRSARRLRKRARGAWHELGAAARRTTTAATSGATGPQRLEARNRRGSATATARESGRCSWARWALCGPRSGAATALSRCARCHHYQPQHTTHTHTHPYMYLPDILALTYTRLSTYCCRGGNMNTANKHLPKAQIIKCRQHYNGNYCECLCQLLLATPF